jgi:hypothetical protein
VIAEFVNDFDCSDLILARNKTLRFKFAPSSHKLRVIIKFC